MSAGRHRVLPIDDAFHKHAKLMSWTGVQISAQLRRLEKEGPERRSKQRSREQAAARETLMLLFV